MCLLVCLEQTMQDIAVCALFLAAKVEEQPRKMEYVISIAQTCMQRTTPTAAPAKGVIADEVRVVCVSCS